MALSRLMGRGAQVLQSQAYSARGPLVVEQEEVQGQEQEAQLQIMTRRMKRRGGVSWSAQWTLWS